MRYGNGPQQIRPPRASRYRLRLFLPYASKRSNWHREASPHACNPLVYNVEVISRKRANIFDGLRFGAAFLLALGHVAPEALLSHSVSIFLLSGIVSTTFFALSGFILC